MRDAAGHVLYVGKATSLRTRVASYFRARARLHPRIAAMVDQVHHIEPVVTQTEAEALLLECQLIKDYQPRYNVAFRDDKSFPLIRLSNEPFPRIGVVRRKKRDDGAIYYGPYDNPRLLREAMRLIRRIFPYRSCRVLPKRPCLFYDLKLCDAPCAGYINQEAYADRVRQIRLFIEGRRKDLIDELSRRMKQLSERHQFEEAAKVRDQFEALSSMRMIPRRFKPLDALEELKEALRLKAPPQRIEGFDIANIAGHEAVGSMVVFDGGRPFKADYRKFKIKEVQGIDDYEMMREVLRRRYGGDLAKTLSRPDLILIDGGKGHLSAAQGVLYNIGRAEQAVAALAKEYEHLFVPWKKEELVLPPSSKALRLLQQVRDEAHRFAQAYHHTLRKKLLSESALDDIPGIGPARKQALLQRFGTVNAIAQASFDELHALVDERTARALHDHLKKVPGTF